MNRALVGAAIVAFACFTSSARAGEPAPAPAPAPASTATPEASPTTTAPASAQPASTTEPPAAGVSHRTAWPWIIMGTGIALVVTASVLEIHAVSQDDKRQSDETKLFPNQDPAQHAALVASAQDHDDSAKSARTQALIVGTIGFLAIAGSVVLWFVEGGSSSPDEPPSATPKAAKSKKPTFLPSFGPGYAGASFGTSF